MNAPQAPRRARLDWVDAMRGIAALAVALFHAMIVLWIGVSALGGSGAGGHIQSRFDRFASYLSWPAHFGYAGVMLFFVLSGFVIHLPYAGGKRPFAFGSYFVRRFLRIYPPYAAALALSLIVATHVRVDRPLQLDGALLARAFFFLQNYPHAGGPFAELAWLQPAGNIALWSLPVEFELYLVYPLVRFLMHRFTLTKAMLAVGAVSLAASLLDIFVAKDYQLQAGSANYLPTFAHYWLVWCTGVWLAEKYARHEVPAWNRGWSVVFAASTLIIVASRLAPLPYDVSDYVLTAVFLCAMVWMAHNGGGIRASNPLVKLGDISYSLYLIHMPVFLTLLALWSHFHAGATPTNYLVSVGAALLAIPLAYAFSLAFERPSIALGKRLGRLLDERRGRIAAPATEAKAPLKI